MSAPAATACRNTLPLALYALAERVGFAPGEAMAAFRADRERFGAQRFPNPESWLLAQPARQASPEPPAAESAPPIEAPPASAPFEAVAPLVEAAAIEREVSSRSRTAIGRLWRPLDPELLLTPPPPRRWLLRHPDHDGKPCAPGCGDGLLPRAKVGLLVADGGVGKSMTLCALAACVVTNRLWLGHFHIDPGARLGRVLLALGEEDLEEVHRRLYTVAGALDLDADERRLVAQRVVVLPLAGEQIALLGYGPDGRTRVASAELAELRARLMADGGPSGWSLVALDPLARFGDDDTERDNGAATRLMQCAEQLVTVPGAPTVVVAHHVSSLAARLGEPTSRGVSGIRNAGRWEAALRAEGSAIFFRQTKSNYSRPMPTELELVRGPGGLLRVPSADELRERAHYAEATAADALDRDVTALVAAIASARGPVRGGPDTLATLAGLPRARGRAAYAAALAAGRIVRAGSTRDTTTSLPPPAGGGP
jgi:hypothetical protein